MLLLFCQAVANHPRRLPLCLLVPYPPAQLPAVNRDVGVVEKDVRPPSADEADAVLLHILRTRIEGVADQAITEGERRIRTTRKPRAQVENTLMTRRMIVARDEQMIRMTTVGKGVTREKADAAEVIVTMSLNVVLDEDPPMMNPQDRRRN